MQYIAYNTVKRAYLSMDHQKKWTLTTDIMKAHRSDSKERLMNVVKSQSRLIPESWRLDEIDDPAKNTQQNKNLFNGVNQKTAVENVVEQKIVIHDKYNPVQGKWRASDEYKAVLDAIHTLKTFATQEYATRLRARLTELNNEIVDVEHYVELTPMNLPRAYKATCHIKEAMQERRNIQQQIQLINRIHAHQSPADLLKEEWEKSDEYVDKMYTPRTEYGKTIPWKDVI